MAFFSSHQHRSLLRFRCRYCGAKPGERCTNTQVGFSSTRREPVNYIHAARVKRSAKMRKTAMILLLLASSAQIAGTAQAQVCGGDYTARYGAGFAVTW